MMNTTFDAANDAMIREFFHAWDRRDTEHIMALFTEDAVCHNISFDPLVGKAAIRDFVAGYESRPPDQAEIRHQLATGNLVMNERVDHVTLGDRKFDVAICGVFEIRDGRISRWTDYYDSGQFLSR